MLKVDQARLFEIVVAALAEYTKAPTAVELEAWWNATKAFTLDDVQRALRAHQDDPDEGKRAPRPVDVRRKLNAGVTEGQGCNASDHTGRCQYPGIFSDGTTGDGKWWCPWHRLDHGGVEASRWIEVSRNVPYAEALAKRSARMNQEAISAAGVVDRAWDIAKRHGNRPWQRKGGAGLVELPNVAINLDAEAA